MLRSIIIIISVPLLLYSCKYGKRNKDKITNVDSGNIGSYTIEPIPEDEKKALSERIAHFFDTNLVRSGFNGGILIAKGGNILFEEYIGYKNPALKTDTIDKNTAFHLASTSKPFTGVAILKLVQENKLSLTDTVTKFFPRFPYSGVTIADLLSHRSGLPNYLYFMSDKATWPQTKYVTNQDVLNFMIANNPAPSFKPNTHFSYCNTNFVLLALIIEHITGKKFPVYLKETIFNPLHMEHTFVYQPQDSASVIMSYMPNGSLYANDIFDHTYGDKNVYSTPEDMFKWDRALYNNNFIRQTLLDSAYQPRSHEKPGIHNYGLAWRMLNLPNGKNVIFHNGKWHGFTPAFARLIDEKAVIIILGNKLNHAIYASAREAYNIFGDYNEPTAIPDNNSEEENTEAIKLQKQIGHSSTPRQPQKRTEKKTANKKPPIESSSKKTAVQKQTSLKQADSKRAPSVRRARLSKATVKQSRANSTQSPKNKPPRQKPKKQSK